MLARAGAFNIVLRETIMDSCGTQERLLTELITPPQTRSVSYEYMERTIQSWTEQDDGRFLVYTKDKNFLSFLRTTLADIDVDTNRVNVINAERAILSNVKIKGMSGTPLMLFVDFDRVQANLGEMVAKLKAACSALKIIILTGEADVFEIALLHETGADNFILTPISANSLVAKIALTIRPHGKIGMYIDEGKKQLAAGKAEKAVLIASKVLDLKPDSAAAYMLMGDAHRAQGQTAKALQAYENACDNAALYIEPLKKLASFHASLGDEDKQIEYMEKLDELSPLNVDRKVDLGRLYMDSGREEDAQQTFDKALEHVTREAESRIAEITVAIADACQKSDPTKAEEYYRKAMDTKGFDLRANIDIFNRLGSSLRKQGKWEQAIIEYERALDISPLDENLFYNKALAHSDGRQVKEAYNCLSAVIERNPKFHAANHVLAYNCALISLNAGRGNEAANFARAALDVCPDYPSAAALLQQLTPDS